MFGSSIGRLRVYTDDPVQGYEVLFEGNSGNSWKQWSTQLTIGDGRKLIWEGVRGNDFTGDIAVDDLSVKPGACTGRVTDPCVSNPCFNGGVCIIKTNPTDYSCDCSGTGYVGKTCQDSGLSCDFETDFCQLVQDQTDTLDWTRHGGQTPSSQTGPNSGYQGSRNYVYLEATEKEPGQSARLSTPPMTSSSVWCVQFAYHMYGSSIGRLLFYAEGLGQGFSWNADGDQGNAWKSWQSEISVGPGQKLTWEAVRGSDYTGDIALDDISIRNQRCGNNSVPERPDLCVPNPCSNGGACSARTGYYICECRAGFTGLRCQTEVNPCSSNPCLNGGACSRPGDTYRCDCSTTGYTGLRCEIDSNPCSSAPCVNGGSCTRNGDSYRCDCTRTVFSGDRCQTDNHPCLSTPCANGGFCIRTGSMFRCDCSRTRYTGDRCQTAMDRCSPNPCLNRGVCKMNGDSYTCECSRTGFTGSNCDQQENKDVKCDFENDLCGFVQDTSESLDWTRMTGATPSQQTGPDSGYQRSGYYIYMEATNKQPGDRARMSSPPLTGSTVWCVEFAYHMFGNSMGSLSFYLEGTGQRHSWNASGNQGDVWRTWSTQVTADQGQKLTWEAVRGRDYTSDIALDDISIKPERCNVQGIDPCVSNPCLNGGSCQVNADRGSFTCECSATEFTGTRCQLVNDPCTNNPCMNGGRCSSNGNAYSCDCSGTGRSGLNCQTDQANDPCVPDPCLNSGRCISPGGAIVCDCSGTGYAGNRCEQRPPPVACGKRRQDASVLGPVDRSPVMARIVGGDDSAYGFWPWTTIIGYDKYRNGTYFLKCAGVIISEEWVMTGAFCVKDLEPSRLHVGVGFHDLKSADSHQRNMAVSRVHMHPDYRGVDNFLDSNIALLRLTTSIEWNAYVIPICLPSAGEEPPTGTTCYATGWGDTQGTGSDRFLQQVELPLVSLSDCNRYYGGNANTKMLCAGDTTRSICNGDYGGPLQCRQSDGTYTLYGISSLPGEVDNDCLYAPGLFTKVSRFMEWIEDTKRCTSTFCDNGGVCTLRGGTASCDCSNTHYSGDRCQTAIDVCSSRPCSNGGRCIVGQGSSYTCDCTGTGFSGYTCNGGRQCGLAVKRRGSAGPLVSSQNQTIGAEITNGVDTEYGDWPWQVTVECRANSTHTFACGGVIISDMWVVSAAHCARCTDNSQYTVKIADFRINNYDPYQITRSVTRIVRHPQYTLSVVNDLALFRLSSPLTWSDYIQPVCLPPRKDSDPPPGTVCVVTGWGVMIGSTNQRPNILQEARIPILDNSVCNIIYWYSRPFSSKNMCAGDNIRNVCLGDSGGPLQCLDSDGRYTVYGITSRGPPTCDLPGVFSRVSHALDWIIQYI